MKTFKEFMEQTVPPKSDIDIVPGSGDLDRRSFGIGRKKRVSDFNKLRYGPYNSPQQMQNMRGPRQINFRNPSTPTGLM